MVTKTGTATSAADLYSKLVAFLTTDVDLVAAGEQWAVAWNTPAPTENPSDIVLRGPGLSNQDQVYVGLRLYQDIPTDSYAIQCRGMTGVLPAGQHYADHVNVTPNYVRMFLDAGTMQYWFVANGRRFMVVVKISTVYEAMYAGLFLPYATPDSYPYPMFIGGSAGPIDVDGPLNWRSEHDLHSQFCWPVDRSTALSGSVDSSAWLIDPAGAWVRCATASGQSETPTNIAPEYTGGHYFENVDYSAKFIMTRTIDCYGGDRVLLPCTIIRRIPTDQTYGVLQGAFRCQGVGNSVESLITLGSVDHLVVQNVSRTDFNDYWAMALE